MPSPIYSNMVMGPAPSQSGSAPVDSFALLLDAPLLASVRTKANNNTSQWQDYDNRTKNDADIGLNVVTGAGSSEYQGASLTAIADHACRYAVLKRSNPTEAAKSADKAIAMMIHGARNNIRLGGGTREYLARGDGSTTVFNLPSGKTDAIVSSTFKVFLATVQVATINNHVTNADDESVSVNARFLKVSNTSDGPANYTERTITGRNPTTFSAGDWAQSPELRDDFIKWSGASSQPAATATYFVSYIRLESLTPLSGGSYTLGSTTVTLNTPPTTSQCVVVEYQYGTFTSGASTLGYQQTGDGRQGFGNIYTDSSYTARWLGKMLSIGRNWLDGYAGFSSSLKAEIEDLLVRWDAYGQTLIVDYTSVANNYGCGWYCSRVFGAIALKAAGNSNAASIMSAIKTFRTGSALPRVTADPAAGVATWKGGLWGEGWNYGDLAVRNFLLPALAFSVAGEVTPTEEKAWTNDLIQALFHGQPTLATVSANSQNFQGSIWDGGDGYNYPEPMVSKALGYVAGVMATDGTLISNINYFIQGATQNQTKNWEDLLYHDPNASAVNWTASLPTSYHATGPDCILARADWSYNTMWISFFCGNPNVSAGHAGNNPGHLRIQRGADDLLIDVPAFTGLQTSTGEATYTPPDHKPTASNIVILDSHADGDMTYDNNTGVWYGNPGTQILKKDLASTYLYAYGTPKASWSKNTNPGAGGAATVLDRCIMVVWPDIVVVYDRIDLLHSTDTAKLSWYTKANITLTGDAWATDAIGSSKLFGTTVCGSAITSTDSGSMTVGGVSGVHRASVVLTTGTASQFQFCTVLQSAASGGSQYTVTRIVSGTDWEGVIVNGVVVVLFGQTPGPINTSGGKSYSYTGTNLATINHFVADLTPSQSYTLSGAASGSVVASAAGVINFTTTGTGSSQTVTIT